jgi:hypothetical protein
MEIEAFIQLSHRSDFLLTVSSAPQLPQFSQGLKNRRRETGASQLGHMARGRMGAGILPVEGV